MLYWGPKYTDEQLKKMTLREVMDNTSDIPISKGGLKMMIHKIVFEIEEIKRIQNEHAK